MFNLLHFTDGSLPYNYFLFAFVASLGVLQMVAARYKRSRLVIFAPNVSNVLGCIMLVGAFVWFFTIENDLFIPGLAGGELFVEFAGAFAGAVIVTRLIVLARIFFARTNEKSMVGLSWRGAFSATKQSRTQTDEIPSLRSE